MDSSWAPKSPDLSSYHAEQDVPLHPQHQGYRGSVSHIDPYIAPSTSNPALQQYPPQPIQPAHMPRGVRNEESMQDADYAPDASEPIDSAPDAEDNGTGPGSTLPPGAENIVIRNHFPVARIKRIMQADDDVGKVAQVTPVVVSKALELFMISLVTKAAVEAKARNSKRVTSVHLKQAISKNEQFDFLSEIVSKVAEAPEKSDDAMDVDTKKSKKKAGSRKKSKIEDEDE